MAPVSAMRTDVAGASELRRLARKEPRRRTAQRMPAIADALEGMGRAEAARAAGIERRSLRDAVLRFNAEGLAGLADRPYGRRPERLSDGEQAALAAPILRGPDPERGAPSSWTLPDLCRFVEARFDKTMCPQSMSRVVRRLGPSRQKARPGHPRRSAKAAQTFAKGAPYGRRGRPCGSPGHSGRAVVPDCPDLNPVERIRLSLRERFLPHRLPADLDAVMDACCRAWNPLASEPDRIPYPYLQQLNAWARGYERRSGERLLGISPADRRPTLVKRIASFLRRS